MTQSVVLPLLLLTAAAIGIGRIVTHSITPEDVEFIDLQALEILWPQIKGFACGFVPLFLSWFAWKQSWLSKNSVVGVGICGIAFVFLGASMAKRDHANLFRIGKELVPASQVRRATLSYKYPFFAGCGMTVLLILRHRIRDTEGQFKPSNSP